MTKNPIEPGSKVYTLLEGQAYESGREFLGFDIVVWDLLAVTPKSFVARNRYGTKKVIPREQGHMSLEAAQEAWKAAVQGEIAYHETAISKLHQNTPELLEE